MLEISHKQAQYLIRQSLDARSGDGRRLPEEQWSALQAHLEGCEACRIYREQSEALEKNLRRILLDRWHAVNLPGEGMEAVLARIHRSRQERVQQAARVGMRALALLLIGLAVFLLPRLGRDADQNSLPAAQIQPTVTVTPEPTLSPGDRFEGAVIYEARHPDDPGGQTDIFLLRTGPEEVEISNMSQNPANDTYPIWSPDGEWIAFLSDRSKKEGQPGKTELWVMTIAGTRLTQLTNTPGITWEGPLAWSPDGARIALVGRRVEQGDVPWVSLISLMGKDEREPVAVPGTRGVTGPLQFAQDSIVWGISLFYRSPDQSVIRRLSLNAGTMETITDAVPGYTVGRAFEIRSFVEYMELIYTLVEQDGVSVWRLEKSTESPPRTYILDRLPHGAASGLIFMPQSPRVAFSGGPEKDGCRDISIWSMEPEPFSQMRLDACLEGELDKQQLSSKLSRFGHWAVARGRDPETGGYTLFAITIPHPELSGESPTFYPLAEVPGMSGPPRVRPVGQDRLEIDPQAAGDPVESLPTVEQPQFLHGNVLMTVQSVDSSSIVVMSPDGSNMQSILPAEAGDPASESALYQCPTISPDGKQIAYLSDKSAEMPGLTELYVMDVEGGQIYRRNLPRTVYAAYDCPVWSPDGQALAVVVRAFGIGYLAVFSNGESEPDYLTIDMSSVKTLPSWSADGRRIYLANPRHTLQPAEIAAYEWLGPDGGLTTVDWKIELDGWEDVQAMSPSTDSMAVMVVRYQPVQAELRVYSLEDQRLVYRKQIGEYDPRGPYGHGRIAWMQGDQVVFAQYGAPLDRYKAQIWRYDPSDDTVQRLAATEDVLYDWAIRGGWMVFSTESGVWGNTITGRLDDPTAPVRLADFTVTSLDWR